jgi:hypothetical protein
MNRSNGYSRPYELVAIVAFVVVAAALLHVLGGAKEGTVTGTVNFKGKPLPNGVVTIVDGNGHPRRGRVHRDGSFTVPGVSPGSAKVTVAAPISNVIDPENVWDPYGPYVAIPKHYARPDKSGLSLTVGPGTQDVVIDLKDDFEDTELPHR